MTIHPRIEFWQEITAFFSRTADWNARFSFLGDAIKKREGGWTLVRGAPRTDLPNGDEWSIGGHFGENARGLQCFLIAWEAHTFTSIHGHPNAMFMYVIEGDLCIDRYERPNERNAMPCPSDTQHLRSGEWVGDAADNQHYDNFIHRITANEPTWSLHLYSDHPALGIRY